MKGAEPGWFVLTLAGFAALLGSFLPFYTFAEGVDVTVWSRGLFPTAALIPLLGLVVGLQALFVLIAGHEPRSPFLNFTWEQVRLAAGAFMILLALSYLLQDRTGGSLGSGYVVLSLASLVTFAGGVMTRRAQLARGGEAARKRQLQLKPAVATVNRAGAGLVRSIGAFGRSAAKGTSAVGRSAARGTASLGRNVGAHLGFGEPNDAKQHGATLDAKLDGELDAQPPPPPPGTLVEKLPQEPLPPPPGTLVEKLPEEPVEATVEKPVEEIADEPVAEATDEEPVAETTVEEPVAETTVEEPVAETTVEEPVAETTAEEPVAEATAEEPVAETTVEEPVAEATAEKPDEKADEPTEEMATEPARVATLSAVPPEAEPDATAAPDGDAPPPASERPDGSDKVAARKPKRRRQPAKKTEKVERVEKKATADDDKEPQSPAAPG
jgi:hypothetical protein